MSIIVFVYYSQTFCMGCTQDHKQKTERYAQGVIKYKSTKEVEMRRQDDGHSKNLS